MPLYEYRCDECTDTFELLTPFSEREKVHSCPSCASDRTHVLISAFAFSGQGDKSAAADFGAAEPQRAGGGCCGGSCGCGH